METLADRKQEMQPLEKLKYWRLAVIIHILVSTYNWYIIFIFYNMNQTIEWLWCHLTGTDNSWRNVSLALMIASRSWTNNCTTNVVITKSLQIVSSTVLTSVQHLFQLNDIRVTQWSDLLTHSYKIPFW